MGEEPRVGAWESHVEGKIVGVGALKGVGCKDGVGL